MNQATILMIGSVAAMLLGTASGLEGFRVQNGGGRRTLVLAQTVATIVGAALTVFLLWAVSARGV